MSLQIAVASGKGGTGKTTIGVGLASEMAALKPGVTYIDCDVEEPNGHLFLKPGITEKRAVSVPVPVIDRDLCNACGACGSFCRFKAIVNILDKVHTFPELCHGCGGCSKVCEVKAIREALRVVGYVETGTALPGSEHGPISFVQGRLEVKELQATQVIRAARKEMPDRGTTIIDAPPGAACAMVAATRGTDLVLLVTEPTPFGLNDLEIAVSTVRELGLPAAVVVNRSDVGDERVKRYCEEEGLEILAEIPHDRAVAIAYSRGELITEAVPEFGERIRDMIPRIYELVQG